MCRKLTKNKKYPLYHKGKIPYNLSVNVIKVTQKLNRIKGINTYEV